MMVIALVQLVVAMRALAAAQVAARSGPARWASAVASLVAGETAAILAAKTAAILAAVLAVAARARAV